MKITSILLLTLLAVPSAFAEDLTGIQGIGISNGLAVPLGSAYVRERGSVNFLPGLWYRRGLTERWSLGASYDMYMPNHIGIQNFFGSAYYHILPASRFNPYARLGMGLSELRGFATPRKEAFGLKLAAGADWFAQKELSVGAELGYHLSGKNSPSGHEAHLFTMTVSAGFWFGCGKAAERPEAAAESFAAGSAATAAEAAPPDADADGVPDARDRCPDTPAGTPVNSMGCPRGQKVNIELRLQFDSGKAKVKRKYDGQLAKVAEFLRTYPDVKAEIEGHTDNVGKAAKNKALSQERADAVRQSLIERFQVAPDRLTAVGYGGERPVADNISESGRARNRRVVASFSATQD